MSASAAALLGRNTSRSGGLPAVIAATIFSQLVPPSCSYLTLTYSAFAASESFIASRRPLPSGCVVGSVLQYSTSVG